MIVLGAVTGLHGAALLSLICALFYYWAFRQVEDYPYEEQTRTGKTSTDHNAES
jgi:hypothetical protein